MAMNRGNSYFIDVKASLDVNCLVTTAAIKEWNYRYVQILRVDSPTVVRPLPGGRQLSMKLVSLLKNEICETPQHCG